MLIVLVVVLTAAEYWRGAFTFFAVDDYVYLANPKWTFWKDTLEFFTYPRGLAESAFLFHRWLFGYHPLLYHIVPFGLHVFNAFLVYRLIRWGLPEHEFAAAIGAILFTLHPAAYTPLAWLSQGFETMPCTTLTLCAAHLFIAHLERRGRFSLLAAMVLMTAAIAFKLNIVLMPAYAGSVGLLFVSRAPDPQARRRAMRRVAVALIPIALLEVALVWDIMWRLPYFGHPSYARDLSPRSLARSYEQLLLHTFNVLPVFRHAIGYQGAIPAEFRAAGLGASIYHAAVAAAAVAIGVMAVRRGQFVFVISMAAIVVGGLSFAAPLSHHLMDYYGYFVSPAACALLAFPLALLFEPRWLRTPPRGRILVGAALVVYAFAAGTVLHPVNHVIRQADTARAVDEFVRTTGVSNQELVFVPTNGDINGDLAAGLSISVLHPEKHLSVRFPSVSESQAFSGTPDRTMPLAVEDLAGRGPRVYRLDSAQTNDVGVGPHLRSGQRVSQRFQVHQNGLSEVHVRLEHFDGACAITASLYELADTRVRIGSHTLPCADDRFQIIPVERQRQSVGKTYELELSAATGSTPRLFHVTPVPLGFMPFVESSADNGASLEARVLAFRVVVDAS